MEQHPRVLVVEDESDLADLVAYNLRQEGFEAVLARDGASALEKIHQTPPDLVLLDVMLPRMSGFEVAAEIRREPRIAGIPIIMLTAKAAEQDQLTGLEAGADDYITKPFSMKVLVARIRTVLRRSATPEAEDGSMLTLAGIRIDLETHQVWVDGELISLTLTEFRILAALLSAKGKVLNRASLISRAIGPGVTVTERTIDVHVTSIRKKLGEHASVIRTVRGVGYRAVESNTEPAGA